MNTNRNDDKLDELISGAIGRDKPKFNFDKWKHEHEKKLAFLNYKRPAARFYVPPNRRIYGEL